MHIGSGIIPEASRIPLALLRFEKAGAVRVMSCRLVPALVRHAGRTFLKTCTHGQRVCVFIYCFEERGQVPVKPGDGSFLQESQCP